MISAGWARPAAWVHLALTLLVIGFQIGLAAGMPWGELAMGGQWPGVFPAALRVAAVGQAALAGAMTAVVAARAGLIGWVFPPWAIWAVLALAVAGAVMNVITPSTPERMLWGPVTVVLLACVTVTLRATRR